MCCCVGGNRTWGGKGTEIYHFSHSGYMHSTFSVSKTIAAFCSFLPGQLSRGLRRERGWNELKSPIISVAYISSSMRDCEAEICEIHSKNNVKLTHKSRAGTVKKRFLCAFWEILTTFFGIFCQMIEIEWCQICGQSVPQLFIVSLIYFF